MLTAGKSAGTYTFTYDGAGNRAVATDGGGAETDSTFDEAGRLSARALSAPGADPVMVVSA